MPARRSLHTFSVFAAVLLVALSPAIGTDAQADRASGPPRRWLDGWRLSGSIALESRAFLHSARHPGQERRPGGSLVVQPELHREWADGDQSVTFEPFLRLDSLDAERSHWDLRELTWRRSWRRWQLVAGVSRVFWGVAESQHLVDVVNQTDLVESPDGEDKLGQPMVRATSIRSWGTVDLFLLPGFRERTFPGEAGRLRPGVPIDNDSPLYESAAEDGRLDWALRWSHAVGAFDLGLSHFAGTSREPLLVPSFRRSDDEVRLRPYYPLIQQTGLDAQATLGSWLWKVEAIRRSGFEVDPRRIAAGLVRSANDSFTATTVGFERTFWGVFGTSVDVGALAEHLWDERNDLATSPFQNDLFTGARIAFNDAQSTAILAGVIYDLDHASRLFLLEASRRIGAAWRLESEARVFSGQRPQEPLAALANDDYVQVSMQVHF